MNFKCPHRNRVRCILCQFNIFDRNGSSGAISVSPSTIRCKPTGPISMRGSVRPALPIVRSSPGSPEIWSAWKCVKQITSIALKPQPSIFMGSPAFPRRNQSRASLPLSLANMAVRKRLGMGIMPPVPSKQISNIRFLLCISSIGLPMFPLLSYRKNGQNTIFSEGRALKMPAALCDRH